MAAAAQALIEELETCTHAQRHARMVQLGREPDSAEAIVYLYAGHGFYGKQLAIMSCYGSRDVTLLKESVTSSSKGVRELALRVLLDVARNEDLLQVLGRLNTAELKSALRKLHKAGPLRAPVLECLVEDAAIAADRSQLEAVIAYGAPDQVVKHWPLVEGQASHFTWGFMANYHPEYIAGRIALLKKDEFIDKWPVVEKHLLMHCPDQAWAILEVLPRSQINRLDLDLIAKKYPAHMMQLLMRAKAEEDEEEEGGKGQRGRTAEGTTQSPASKAAKRSISMTPSIAAREAPVEAGAVAGAEAGVSARPAAPAVYDLIQRKAFMSSEDARDKLCRGLKRRLHTLSDADLLQVLLMRLFPTTHILRSVPAPRRLVLYNAWRAKWGEQYSQLQELLAAERGAGVTIGSLADAAKVMASKLQDGMFKMWVPQNSTGSKVEQLLRWLPHSTVADLMHLVITEATSYWAGFSATSIGEWLEQLGEHALPLLEAHPKLLDQVYSSCPDLATKLLSKLSWEQQVSLCRQRQSRLEGQLEDSRGAVANVMHVHGLLLPVVSVASIKPGVDHSPDWADQWVDLEQGMDESMDPAPSSHELSAALHAILDKLSASERALLLRIVPTPGNSAGPPAPFGLSGNATKQATLLVDVIKPKALEALFDDWCAYWDDTKSLLTQLHLVSRALHPPGSLNPAHLAQPESLPTAERHRRRAAWTGLAVAGALRRAAVEAAFAPWSTAAPKTTRRAWHALPPGDLGRMRLMWLYRRADVEGARKLLVATEAFLKTPAPMRVDGSFPTAPGAALKGLDASAAVALLTEAEAAEAAAARRNKLMLPYEADIWADLEPGFFLQTPHMMQLLDAGAQQRLILFWSALYRSREEQLAGLLAATGQLLQLPSGSALLREQAAALLLSNDPVASSALTNLEPQAARTLFETCRHAWSSDFGRMNYGALPEPYRSEMVQLRIAEVVAENPDPKNQYPLLQSLLPWLPWRQMVEHPCVKEKLQGRTPADRQEGLMFLFKAATTNPAHLPQVMEVAHTRRREQDSVRQGLLQRLLELIEAQLASEERKAHTQRLRSHGAATTTTTTTAAAAAAAGSSAATPANRGAGVTGAGAKPVGSPAPQASPAPQGQGLAQGQGQEVLTPRQAQRMALAAAAGLRSAAGASPGASPGGAAASGSPMAGGAAAAGSPIGAGAAGAGRGASAAPEEAEVEVVAAAVTMESQLPAVLTLIEDALSAKDLSNTTLQLLFKVITTLLPRYTAWACSAIVKCTAVYGMQVLSLSQLNTVVLEHSSKILAAAEARKTALGITPSPSAASKAPTPVWGGKPGAKPGAKAGKGKRKARGKGLEEEVLDVEMSVVAPEPEAYCPELQAFLLRLADGLKPVQEALRQRQDGSLGMLQLLQQQWEWGRFAESKHALWFECREVEVWDAPLRGVLLDYAQAAAEALVDVPPLTSWKEVQFFAEVLLAHLLDSFLLFSRHVLPADPADGIAFTSFAVNIVDHIPVERLDIINAFIYENNTMPSVAAKAVKLLFAHHKDKLSTEVPRLLARDITFACLPRVLYYIHNERQDLLPNLVSRLSLGEGMFKGGPPTAATAQKRFGGGHGGAGGRGKRRGGRGGARAGGRGRGHGVRVGGGGGGGGSGGWSRRAYLINYWLGVPQLASQWKWTPLQQQQLGNLLVKVLYRSTISLKDVKNLVNRIALLPAVPPSILLSLLDDPAGAAALAGAGDGGAGAAPPALPETVQTLVKDSVMTALVRLDDSEQAWNALVDSVRSGNSSTALAAIGALLTSSKGWATSGDMGQVLARLRTLPWERTAVMREVVKVLGKLALNSSEAFLELVLVSERENLHRSVMQQLLVVMQAFVQHPEAQVVFMRAASAREAEVAKAAAYVPTAEQQKAPGVVSHTVALFELLLDHPDARVKTDAMSAWAHAASPVPMDRGMTVLNKMLTIGTSADRRVRAQLVSQGQSCARLWFNSVMEKTDWADNAPSLGRSMSGGVHSSEYELVGTPSADMEDA